VRCSPLIVAGLVAGLIATAPAQAGTRHTVDGTIEGAVVRTGSTVVSAFLARDDALGQGAGRLAVRASQQTQTTGSGVLYATRGTLRFRVSLTFQAATGNETPFTGRLTVTGGTGRFRGARGTLELDGSQNVEELTFTAKATGRLTY
jgi:hypothetical protein